ncbi:MAG: hypothetical protein FD143_103 [Ignavibacteria bacterium]|nr:MAG: hypothetical protein FD143_103 [Ignavibacteria bacterium]KAF0162483.1 MAG: hypothetical protein FD188_86 [Ignavibacteria bacterium]
MRISEIFIKNFRSIKETRINPNSFNVLIGQNNHGKTNFFNAIEWFYNGKGDIDLIRHCDANGEDIEVIITFSDVQQNLQYISNEDNQVKLKNILADSDSMQIKRSSDKPNQRFIYNPIEKEYQKQPTGADSAFNNCIPRFEFIEATKSLKEVTSYKNTTPIGQMLSSVIANVLEKDEDYRKFKDQFEILFQSENSKVKKTLDDLSAKVAVYLQQQFSDCTKVEFDVRQPEIDEFLKNYKTNLDDGVKTTAEEKGDGMQRALMLAIIKTHADFRRNEALGRAFVFFIDEAELHLHPTGQRQLKNSLIELTNSVDQVFITTHSSVFIADDHTHQNIYKVDKDNRKTEITCVSRTDRQSIVYDLLGGSPADLLFPSNFLIVEGRSEEIFINNIVKKFYPNKPTIHIVAAHGDDEAQRQSMEAINKVFDPLKNTPIYKSKLILLLDKPDNTKLPRYNEFIKLNKFLNENGQVFQLPFNTLEEYYPKASTSKCTLSKKVLKAKWMSENLTQQQFEEEMSVIFEALNKCWVNAYTLNN